MAEVELIQKTCVPCRGGVPPLTPDELRALRPQAPDWQPIEGDTRIERRFKFRNFRQSLDFVTAVGELAENEFHHPVAITFGWGFCHIVLQTKKIKGLHENDFILAAKIDAIAAAMGEAE